MNKWFIPLCLQQSKTNKMAKWLSIVFNTMIGGAEVFVPAFYSPTEADIRLIQALGMMGVFSFGACSIGAILVIVFDTSLLNHRRKHALRNAGAHEFGSAGFTRSPSISYRILLCFVSILVSIAGLAQFVFGVLVLFRFGSGPFVPAPSVAMFTVTFPELSICVGLLYTLTGMYGLYRAISRRPSTTEDRCFQYVLANQYFCTVMLMIFCQLTSVYAMGEPFLVAAILSRCCLTVGAHILPAILDLKAQLEYKSKSRRNVTEWHATFDCAQCHATASAQQI